jgi:hypothetical protein
MVPVPQLIFVEQFLAEVVRKKALLIEEGEQPVQSVSLGVHGDRMIDDGQAVLGVLPLSRVT